MKNNVDMLLTAYAAKVKNGENLSYAGADLARSTSDIMDWEKRKMLRYMRMKARKIRLMYGG